MTDEDTRLRLSRRKALAALGTIGAASAGAGLGTSAYFSDVEMTSDNRLVAGSLDLKIDWEEHYSDWSADEEGAVSEVLMPEGDPDAVPEGFMGLPDPQHPQIAVPTGDVDAFMDATALEAFPDSDDDGTQDPPAEYDPCEDGADTPDDLDPRAGLRTANEDTLTEEGYRPLVAIEDVKPGDFGEVTFSFHLCDNPGYVWLKGGGLEQSENGLTEPEAEVDETPEQGELADAVRTVWWYDSRGDNVLQEDCPERLHLTDSGPGDFEVSGDEDPGIGSRLFEVILDDGDMEAELHQLVDLTPEENFERVDSIATTPNGAVIYAYDKDSGHVGRYHIDQDTFQDLGQAVDTSVGDPPEIVLAGFSPRGTLWAVDQVSDELYTVDPSGPTATTAGDTGINVFGADVAFASDGTLYIWTNDDPGEDDDKGLYKIDDPATDPTAEPVDITTIGDFETDDAQMTGLAVRGGGNGNLVASDTADDQVVVIDRTDGSIVDEYEMTPVGGTEFAGGEEAGYGFGDMTAGAICGEVFRRGTLADDLPALASGKGIPLDGNRASGFDELADAETDDDRECFAGDVTHYIGFAWYVPTSVGNEIQTDSLEFDVGFYTEQCRHNDGGDAPVTEDAET